MSRQRSVRVILNQVHNGHGNAAISPDVTPEARLLSMLTATQSTLTVESAGRVAYINIARSFFQCGPMGRRLEYLLQKKLVAVVWANWISTAAFLALPFCGNSSATIVMCVCIHITLATPATLCSIASLNRDIIQLLVREPEFRFVSLFNAVHWTVVAVAFRDLRALSCCSMWLTAQIAFAVDANTRALERVLNSIPQLAATVLVLLAYSFTEALGDSRTWIMQVGVRRVSLHDVLVTTAPTLALFWARVLYHQRGRLRSRQLLPGTKPMYCSIYPKRLVLQAVLLRSLRRQAKITPRVIPTLGIPMLRSHAVMSHVNTTDTVLFVPQRFTDTKKLTAGLVLLYAVGIWGYVGAVYATIVEQARLVAATDGYHPAITISALVATVVYCAAFATMYQRSLVVALASTFDFSFSSLQFTAMCLCLGDEMRWDLRSVNLLTWWFWFHFALLLDALTPPVRAALRFVKYSVAGLVLMLIYGYLVTIGLIFYYGDDAHLFDRAWLSARASSAASASLVRLPLLRTESVLIGRLVTLALWNMRLFWDLGVRADAEFVILRDLAEYYTPSASCAQLLGLTSVTPQRLRFGPRASTVGVSPGRLGPIVGVGSIAVVAPHPTINGSALSGSNASSELTQSPSARRLQSDHLDVPFRIDEEDAQHGGAGEDE